MEDQGGNRRTPLDDVDHLARSPHRARVVLLFAEGDWTRRELHEDTGIPQPTLGRILGSFQERKWLVRDGNTYALTPLGRLVADRFQALLDAVETVQDLPAAAEIDSLIELGFEIEWLAGAEVITPTETSDPWAHLRSARESVQSVDRMRELSPGPLPGMAEVIAERLQAGDLTVETVFARDAFEAFIDDPEQRSLIVEMLATGRVDLYLFDGPIPRYVSRQGEQAVLSVNSPDGALLALLITEELAALAWVDSVVDDYEARSDPVAEDDLAQ